jgi:hypothetical protein
MAPIDQVLKSYAQNVKEKFLSNPSTGRFHTIVLYGPECAWNPDDEVKDFVADTLKYSGYNLENFGLNQEPQHTWTPGI